MDRADINSFLRGVPDVHEVRVAYALFLTFSLQEKLHIVAPPLTGYALRNLFMHSSLSKLNAVLRNITTSISMLFL